MNNKNKNIITFLVIGYVMIIFTLGFMDLFGMNEIGLFGTSFSAVLTFIFFLVFKSKDQ